MTGVNHAITGATIVAVIGAPIALPLAFASHFVLDATPHFGMKNHSGKRFFAMLIVDAVLTVSFLAFLIMYSPANLGLMLAGAFFAMSPDLAWAYRLYNETYKGADPDVFHDPITKFHARIQWYDKPIGIFVELAWFLLMAIILARYI